MSRFLTLVPLLGLPSCAWVTLDDAAGAVGVADPAEVVDCRKLAETRVEVRDRVLAVQRSPRRVAVELETLARNAAADIGGDRIVALGPVERGTRGYAVYDCD